MKRKLNRSLLGPVIAALVCRMTATAGAAPLVLDDVTAGAAAAQLSEKYGVTVTVAGAATRHITLIIENADDGGTRLQAVSALANTLGLDFTKTYVVGKAEDGHGVPATLDSTGAIPFGKTTLSAREAIETLGGVDHAAVQVAGDMGGTVTLSGATLTAAQAAQEIAAQTGTTWHLVYTLARRSQDPAHWGRVIGRTAGGSPIVEMPGLYFVDFQLQAQQEREAAATQQKAEQEQAARLLAAQQEALARYQAALQAGLLGNGASGYFPNGYNPSGSLSYNPIGVISSGAPAGGMGGYGGYGFGYGSNFIGSGY